MNVHKHVFIFFLIIKFLILLKIGTVVIRDLQQDNKEEDYNMVSHLGGGSANLQQKFF
jgi:hypothetical protein